MATRRVVDASKTVIDSVGRSCGNGHAIGRLAHSMPTEKSISRSFQYHAAFCEGRGHGIVVKATASQPRYCFRFHPWLACRTPRKAPVRPFTATSHAEDDAEYARNQILKRVPHSCRFGDTRATEKLLKKGLSRTDVDRETLYTAIIDSYRRYGYADKVMDMVNRMKVECGYTPDIDMYHTLISSCGNGKDWQKALEVMRSMPQKGFMPNVDTYTLAIQAMGKSYRPRRALHLLREMPTMGLTPALLTYNAIIHACGSNKEWQKALELLREMPLVGIEPNLISYNTSIQACSRCGKWEEARSLLRETQEKGFEPDIVTYRAAIYACGKADQKTEALNLLRELQATGIPPDRGTFRDAIKACSWPDEPSMDALKILEKMRAVRGKKTVSQLTRVKYLRGRRGKRIPVKLPRKTLVEDDDYPSTDDEDTQSGAR